MRQMGWAQHNVKHIPHLVLSYISQPLLLSSLCGQDNVKRASKGKGVEILEAEKIMTLCICAIICWMITVFSLALLLRRKTDKKLSQVLKLLLLCCFSFLVFFYFPHRNIFQNAEPLQIGLTSSEETAPIEDVLDKERSNTILGTCNRLCVSRSVLGTFFDRSNGAVAYIYFSGRYDNRAKNYIAVKPGGKQAIVKKDGIVYHIWAPVDFLTLLQKPE